MTRVCALSTKDNPYNPITQFDSWYRYDMDKGYMSCSYLDRIAVTSSAFTDEENDREIERAIDEIVFINGELYCKVIQNVNDE